MGEILPKRKSGCGLITAILRRRNLWPRRKTMAGSALTNGNDLGKASNTHNTKRGRGGSDNAAFLGTASSNATNSSCPFVSKPSPNPHNPTLVVNQNHQRKHPSKTSMAVPSSRMGGTAKVSPTQGRKLPKEAVGISDELERMITDHQKSKGSSILVRASSSNVMLFGNLGNLRQGVAGGNTNYHNATDYLAKPREENPVANGRYTNFVMENVVNKSEEDKRKEEQSGSLCRALSTRMDPEQLKIMGNEDYKNGRFAEALALYDAAISIDPNKASYRSNRSAALTALGRLMEAVTECREAIRIDAHYYRAHHRLGNLYTRLGETDKALYHYKRAGPEADPAEIAKTKNLQVHLNKCTEARRSGDWNTLIKETNYAISSGADSAPQIFALQAEAFLKLRRHQDADAAMSKGPNFDINECTKFFGPIGYANLLVTRAQVDMAAGRFEDALEALQRAARLDSNNREVKKVMMRARAAQLLDQMDTSFLRHRDSEACVAYGEGLEHDPYDSILLCNRAACRSKLGQFERAVEDCTAALN